MRPLSPCGWPRCPQLAWKEGKCQEHYHAARRLRDRRRGTAAERGYDAEWKRTRDAYLERNPACERCGRPATEVHHRLALRFGGERLDSANLVSMCRSCHQGLTNRGA
jgi:5-methylcytosine-specific restriction protein A